MSRTGASVAATRTATANDAAGSQQAIWFAALVAALVVWIGLPWLAPVFMQLGWELPARWLYWFYSFQCHQLPQRSFFLFGSAPMYSLSELAVAGVDTSSPFALREFVGNAALGYKVAWSDRMVSMYTTLPLAALVWWPLRRRLRPLTLRGLALFLFPMAIDGGTHLISDLAGLGQGFRYTNAWLAQLTGGALPTWFYVGNGLGSFNSRLRLLTGVLFGIGVVWAVLPHLLPPPNNNFHRHSS